MVAANDLYGGFLKTACNYSYGEGLSWRCSSLFWKESPVLVLYTLKENVFSWFLCNMTSCILPLKEGLLLEEGRLFIAAIVYNRYNLFLYVTTDGLRIQVAVVQEE